jgi:hypothetical protein
LAAADWQKVAAVLHLHLHLRGPHSGQVQRGEPACSEVEWVVEHEAYHRVTDGRISWIIVLCDGCHRSSSADDAEGPDQAELSSA